MPSPNDLNLLARLYQSAVSDEQKKKVNSLLGLLEVGGNFASGSLAQLGGGLSYLPAAAMGGNDAGQAVMRSVQDAYTYQPRGDAGQRYLGALGNLVGPIAKSGGVGAQTFADNVYGATGSPVLGAAARTAPTAIDQLLNRTRLGALGGVKKSDIFGGESAKTFPTDRKIAAEKLEASGADARQIYEATGMWRGPGDGKWRFEINDEGSAVSRGESSTSSPDNFADWMDEAQARDRGVSLPQAFSHGPLYGAYPSMKAMRAKVIPEDTGTYGAYRATSNTVESLDPYAAKGGEYDQRSTILHELQHATQDREGFSRGGSPTEIADQVLRADAQIRTLNQEMSWAAKQMDQNPKGSKEYDYARNIYDKAMENKQSLIAIAQMDPAESYRLLGGEAEARAVQSRRNLTPAQRRTAFPLDSYDVPLDKLIHR